MDILTLLRTVWRHRLAALPAVVLTLAGILYVGAFSPKVYTLTTSQVLLAPPPPPEELGASVPRGRPVDNPLTRLPSQTVIVDLLSRRMMTDANGRRLLAKGATAQYEVVPSMRYGTASPILDINVEGPTAGATSRTAELVGAHVHAELRAMQAELGVVEPRMFTALPVAEVDPPVLKTSALLRSLIAVAAAGALLVFAAVSVAEALETRRRQRARMHVVDPPRIRSTEPHAEVHGAVAMSGGTHARRPSNGGGK